MSIRLRITAIFVSVFMCLSAPLFAQSAEETTESAPEYSDT